MTFDIDLNNSVLKSIQKSLESAVDDALTQKDMDSVASQMLATILLRTSRGRFLTSKTGGREEVRTYRSESWKKKRAAKGLQTGRVNLFFGEGGLLEAMRAKGRSVGGDIELEAGYIQGMSEQRAAEIARYMNDTGIGKSRVIYRYIGFTNAEENRIVTALRNRIRKNIQAAT